MPTSPYLGRSLETNIEDGEITNAKLAPNCVNASKIEGLSVNSAALGNNAVTNAKINNGAVAEVKLAVAVQTKLNNPAPSRGALVYRNIVQSILNDSDTQIDFPLEVYDTDNIHDNVTNNDRLTVPAGVTKIKLTANVTFANNFVGTRRIFFYKNDGSGVIGGGSIQIAPTNQLIGPSYLNLSSAILNVTAGDHFKVGAYQNSGGALNTGTNELWFAMEIVE